MESGFYQERVKNMKLEKNQILITISEDKKLLTVECGAFNHPIDFSNCPKETIGNIGNAVKSYDERTGLSSCISEWKPSGCFYDGNGTCNDCN